MDKLSHGCTLDCFDCCKFNVYVEEGKIIKIEVIRNIPTLMDLSVKRPSSFREAKSPQEDL